VSVSSLKKTLL